MNHEEEQEKYLPLSKGQEFDTGIPTPKNKNVIELGGEIDWKPSQNNKYDGEPMHKIFQDEVGHCESFKITTPSGKTLKFSTPKKKRPRNKIKVGTSKIK